MTRILPLPIVLLILVPGLLVHALEPANPQTNAKAQAVLNTKQPLGHSRTINRENLPPAFAAGTK